MKTIYLALALASCAAIPANAACGPTEKVYEELANKHGESRVMTGIMQDGAVIETWANTEKGTWTIFATLPNGMSCGVVAGDKFELWENYQGKPNL